MGFGSLSKPQGRLVTPLTDDQDTFYNGLSNLQLDGADEAGFTATSYVVLDDGRALGGYMDGDTGISFPSQNGFCAFLVTDEPSNHDISSRNPVGEVAPLLLNAGNCTVFGVVRSDQLSETGNTYGHLAAATGGHVMDIKTLSMMTPKRPKFWTVCSPSVFISFKAVALQMVRTFTIRQN